MSSEPGELVGVAPFGGILAGFLLGGMRSRSRASTAAPSSIGKRPALRVVQGGADEPKSKNPKDKRDLN